MIAVRAEAAAAVKISDLTSEVAQLKTDLAHALANASEAQSLELATLSASMAAQKEVAKLKEELSQTRAAVAKAQEVGGEVSQAQHINTEMASLLGALSKEIHQLRGSLEKESAGGENRAEVDHLRNELEVAKSEVVDKRAVEAEVSTLRSQLKQARAEAAAAVKDLSNLANVPPPKVLKRMQMKLAPKGARQQKNVDNRFEEDDNWVEGSISNPRRETPRWLKVLTSGRTLRIVAMAPLVAFLTFYGGDI